MTHTLFIYETGGYAIASPTPPGLQTPDGATRTDYAARPELDAAISAYLASTPTPDWDGFNTYILINSAFDTAYNLATPKVQTVLITAYSVVATGNYASFSWALEQMCAIAIVPQLTRDAWADEARDTCHLPAAFVDVLRGS